MPETDMDGTDIPCTAPEVQRYLSLPRASLWREITLELHPEMSSSSIIINIGPSHDDWEFSAILACPLTSHADACLQSSRSHVHWIIANGKNDIAQIHFREHREGAQGVLAFISLPPSYVPVRS